MARKKINLTFVLFFIIVSVALISIEINTHINHVNQSAIDSSKLQLLEEKSADSLVFEIDEEEIQLPVDMKE